MLGTDFIRAARIILDLPQGKWYFAENSQQCYDFLDESATQLPESEPTLVSAELRTVCSADPESVDSEQRRRLNALLSEFEDVFSPNIEATPFAEHVIKLTDDVPIAMPPYRVSPARREYLANELEKMLADDVIEECESPYAAPVVMVPKKDGSLRLCVDYRRLNAVTVPDKYPLPRIDDLLHVTKNCKYISTIDLKSGYWQVSVREEDRDKTAFTTPLGNFRWKRMPFGLRNAPSTFQRLIDRFKSGLKDIFLLAYLDDLIILSSTFQEYLEHLRRVFER